jgi:hypothetical protein
MYMVPLALTRCILNAKTNMLIIRSASIIPETVLFNNFLSPDRIWFNREITLTDNLLSFLVYALAHRRFLQKTDYSLIHSISARSIGETLMLSLVYSFSLAKVISVYVINRLSSAFLNRIWNTSQYQSRFLPPESFNKRFLVSSSANNSILPHCGQT